MTMPLCPSRLIPCILGGSPNCCLVLPHKSELPPPAEAEAGPDTSEAA